MDWFALKTGRHEMKNIVTKPLVQLGERTSVGFQGGRGSSFEICGCEWS